MSPFFKYHAKDDNGNDRDGEIDAVDKIEALSKLRGQGLTIISLEITGRKEIEKEIIDKQAEEKQHSTTKKCPYCAEEIQFDAIKCRYCGEMLASKKFECTISKISAHLIKTIKMDLGLTYTWLEGDDAYEKILIEAKDMETVTTKLNSKDISIEGIAEIFADGQRGEVYNKCINCTKLKSIDAEICPYCGKQSSFLVPHIFIGMLLTGVAHYIIYRDKPFEDKFWSFVLWIIIGGIVGAVSGIIQKSKIKKSGDGSQSKLAKHISKFEKICKKFYKWFISIGIFLLALGAYILCSEELLNDSLGAVILVISLISMGIILIVLGAEKFNINLPWNSKNK